MGRISTSSRYAVDVTGPDPFSLGSWGDNQCFGEFSASGRPRTIKIGRRVRDLYKMT